ncbi:MAG: hypothetical protein UD936_04600 [Acutalibacteraceae bacterium]|nr:hypothetical protein [Acutalibacteraceae bacterium]
MDDKIIDVLKIFGCLSKFEIQGLVDTTVNKPSKAFISSFNYLLKNHIIIKNNDNTFSINTYSNFPVANKHTIALRNFARIAIIYRYNNLHITDYYLDESKPLLSMLLVHNSGFANLIYIPYTNVLPFIDTAKLKVTLSNITSDEPIILLLDTKEQFFPIYEIIKEYSLQKGLGVIYIKDDCDDVKYQFPKQRYIYKDGELNEV